MFSQVPLVPQVHPDHRGSLARRENRVHQETLVLQVQLVTVVLGACLVLAVISALLDRSEHREPPDHPGLLGWRDLLVKLVQRAHRGHPVPLDPRASVVPPGRRVRRVRRGKPVGLVQPVRKENEGYREHEDQQDRKENRGWSVHQDPWDPPVPPDPPVQPAHQDSASKRSPSIRDFPSTTTESLPSVQRTERGDDARGSFHEEGEHTEA